MEQQERDAVGILYYYISTQSKCQVHNGMLTRARYKTAVHDKETMVSIDMYSWNSEKRRRPNVSDATLPVRHDSNARSLQLNRTVQLPSYHQSRWMETNPT